MKDSETKQRFLEMRGAGLSYSRISEDIGVSKSTLIEWGRDFSEEIHNRRTLEVDALQRQYAVARENRIKLFGEMAARVTRELEKRDLTSVPTEKLFDVLLKLTSSLKNEDESLTFIGNVPGRLSTSKWPA